MPDSAGLYIHVVGNISNESGDHYTDMYIYIIQGLFAWREPPEYEALLGPFRGSL